MEKKQSHRYIFNEIDPLYTQKQIILLKTLHKMFKRGFTLQISNQTKLKEKTKKANYIENLEKKLIKKTIKQKAQKKCVIKRKIKLEDHENCLKTTQFENKVNYLEKNKIDTDSL